MTSMCMREATSGNTPPYWACLAACEATMLERIVVPSATTAAAVSSQEVSMARMRGINEMIKEQGARTKEQGSRIKEQGPRIKVQGPRIKWLPWSFYPWSLALLSFVLL